MSRNLELCPPCQALIDQANNGDTLTLCPVCRVKGDAVRGAIGWKAVRTRAVVYVNFDPSIDDAPNPLATRAARGAIWLIVAILLALLVLPAVLAWIALFR